MGAHCKTLSMPELGKSSREAAHELDRGHPCDSWAKRPGFGCAWAEGRNESPYVKRRGPRCFCTFSRAWPGSQYVGESKPREQNRRMSPDQGKLQLATLLRVLGLRAVSPGDDWNAVISRRHEDGSLAHDVLATHVEIHSVRLAQRQHEVGSHRVHRSERSS